MSDTEMQDAEDLKEQQIEELQRMVVEAPADAINKLREFLKGRDKSAALDAYQERAVFGLMTAYSLTSDADALIALLKELRQCFPSLSKSKRENIVKSLLDKLSSIPNTHKKQISICKEYITYFAKDKRNFLRQRFEARLASLLVADDSDVQKSSSESNADITESRKLLSKLVPEVKKLDDKLLLVQLHLAESQLYFHLGDLVKARSCLTAARTNGNVVFLSVDVQAELDMQAGVLSGFERDFRTAFSYLYEAHEGFNSLLLKLGVNKGNHVAHQKAKKALAYMLLCKIMTDEAGDVGQILALKSSLAFVSDALIVVLNEVSKCVKKRSLEDFARVISQPEAKKVLEVNKFLKKSLLELEDELLEKNLMRVIEPYSRVDVEKIAKIMKMPEEKVMMKLYQMILDKKLRGIIDQGAGELIIHPEPVAEKTYADSLQLIASMEGVVNNLIRRAKTLHAQ